MCGESGDLVFVVGRTTNVVFVYCPACECAWVTPPRDVSSIDPPAKFAPEGFRAATPQEIATAGFEPLIQRTTDVWDDDI